MISKRNSSIDEKIELRKDQYTHEEVIINAARSQRPEEFDQSGKKRTTTTDAKSCPFCRGNEKKFAPKSVLEEPRGEKWEVRVIPNKYPIISEKSHSIAGNHEVIITHDHNHQVPTMHEELVVKLLSIYQRRIAAQGETHEHVLIFQNEGDEAGASISHPHSQLISFEKMPKKIERNIKEAHTFFEKNEVDLFSNIIAQEKKEASRIVHQSNNFICIAPFASRFPFEMKIYPQKTQPYFEDEKNIKELAGVLQKALYSLEEKLGEPAYNYYIHTLSKKTGKQFEKSVSWFIRIFPRITTWAGLEFATDISVNTMPPEKAASFLKY